MTVLLCEGVEAKFDVAAVLFLGLASIQSTDVLRIDAASVRS